MLLHLPPLQSLDFRPGYRLWSPGDRFWDGDFSASGDWGWGEGISGTTPVKEWGQDWEKEKVNCDTDARHRVLSRPLGELWHLDDISEMSWIKIREPGLCIPAPMSRWMWATIREGTNLGWGSSLWPRTQLKWNSAVSRSRKHPGIWRHECPELRVSDGRHIMASTLVYQLHHLDQFVVNNNLTPTHLIIM